MVYGMSVHFQLLYTSWMNQSLKFFSDSFYQDHQTGYFNTASGTSGTGAYQHQKQKDCPGDFRPLIKVCGSVSCGSDNGTYLECSLLESFAETGVLIGYHHCNHNDRCQDDAKIPPDFFKRKSFLEFFMKDQVVRTEIYTKKDHGNSHHYLKIYRIAGHAVIFDPESSGSCRTECDRQGIE